MDQYTQTTRDWLNERFQKTDARGVYIAHQPVYGYHRGAHEPNVIARLSRTYQILRVLRTLSFSSFLDVGAAEGYFCSLARDAFGAQAVAFDLSREACKRARELYGLDAIAGDAHHLPFADESFDVAYCSEMLEHVADPQQAVRELVRVARCAVVVTAPREKVASSLSCVGAAEPHGHINVFDEYALAKLFSEKIITVPLRYQPLLFVMVAAEGTDLPPYVAKKYHRALVAAYDVWKPFARRIFGAGTVRRLLQRDARLISLFPKQNCDLLGMYQKQTSAAAQQFLDDFTLLSWVITKHVKEPMPLVSYQREAPEPQYCLTQLQCRQCGKQLTGDDRGYKCAWCRARWEGEDGVVDFGV